MDTLFSPWRMAYIQDSDKVEGCIFCKFPSESNDEKRYILHRSTTCFVMLNAYPYNSGHLMVAPYRHIASYDLLTRDELLDLNLIAQKCLSMMRSVLTPQGFNMGINMGKVSGAGFDGHVHLHIVPRWNGDTNFMPVMSQTRVLPEALDETYRKFMEAWALNES